MAQKHFRLLDLPPELVGHVFSFITCESAAKRPICRSLLPFTRRHLLDFVGILNDSQASRLVDLLDCVDVSKKPQTGATLALNVRRLWLSIIFQDLEETLVQQLAHAIGLMRNLEIMAIDHSTIVKGVFRHHRDFQRLKSLDVSVENDFIPQFFDEDQIGSLSNCAALEQIDINLSVPADAANSPAPPGFPSLPQIGSVTVGISGSFATFLPLTTFLSHLPNLEKFVDYYQDEDYDFHTEIDSALFRFTKLESLTLGGGVFSQSPTFYSLLCVHLPSLRNLKIAHLEHFEVNASSLIPYVRARGGSAHSLVRLEIDTCRLFHIGILPSDNPTLPAVVNGSFRLNGTQRWRFPVWTDGMGFEDALELSRVADKAGVE
ncbi:hypothetical protein JCM6882_003692 [Rhodosporidiobolus microsporus]